MNGSNLRGRQRREQERQGRNRTLRGGSFDPQVRQERRVHILRIQTTVSRAQDFPTRVYGLQVGATLIAEIVYATPGTTRHTRPGAIGIQEGRGRDDRDGAPGSPEGGNQSDAIAEAGRTDASRATVPGGRVGRRGVSIPAAQALADQGKQAEEARQADPGGSDHRDPAHGSTRHAAGRHGGGLR